MAEVLTSKEKLHGIYLFSLIIFIIFNLNQNLSLRESLLIFSSQRSPVYLQVLLEDKEPSYSAATNSLVRYSSGHLQSSRGDQELHTCTSIQICATHTDIT